MSTIFSNKIEVAKVLSNINDNYDQIHDFVQQFCMHDEET